ncbi:MAG: (Fe-S)-binding protein [Pseudomonadota bacterium]
MFKPELCDYCGDCLVECQWMDVEREQAVGWVKAMIAGEETPAVRDCVTCYACNEICPRQANPFDLIASLQEKIGGLTPREHVEAREAKLSFAGQVQGGPTGADRIMSVCVFGRTDAHLIQGPLYDLPQVGGKPYFCWILFSHMGALSIQEKHAREMVDRLAATGAREVVCFHDDCYAMLAKLAPEYGVEVPFRPVHLSEYFVEYLKEHRDQIKPLNLDLAYQRPCASRHTPEKEHFIDEVFDLIGVNRVARKYDREKALCCAGVKLMLGQGDPKPDQVKNLEDARQAGAKGVACLCPMCIHSLSGTAGEMGLPLIFLGDLVRMALGEIPPPA